jgi:hypothetical protein
MDKNMSLWLWALVVIFIAAPLLRVRSLVKIWKAKKEIGDGAGSGLVNKDFYSGIINLMGATLLAVAGLNRIFDYPLWHTTEVTGLIVLVVALVLFTIPAYIWEFMYSTGRLR